MTATPTPCAPTPDAPEMPAGAARVPRVSDDLLDTWIHIVSDVAPEDDPLDVRERQILRVSLDLRDARATIADLERRLAEAAEQANAMIALGLRTQIEAHEANARVNAGARLEEVTARAEAAEKERDELRGALRPFAKNDFETMDSYYDASECAARLLPAEPHGQEGEQA